MNKYWEGLSVISVAVFILWLMLMAIFMSASGQQISEELYNKGIASDQEVKYDEALQALDKVIEIKYTNAKSGYR